MHCLSVMKQKIGFQLPGLILAPTFQSQLMSIIFSLLRGVKRMKLAGDYPREHAKIMKSLKKQKKVQGKATFSLFGECPANFHSGQPSE